MSNIEDRKVYTSPNDLFTIENLLTSFDIASVDPMVWETLSENGWRDSLMESIGIDDKTLVMTMLLLTIKATFSKLGDNDGPKSALLSFFLEEKPQGVIETLLLSQICTLYVHEMQMLSQASNNSPLDNECALEKAKKLNKTVLENIKALNNQKQMRTGQR